MSPCRLEHPTHITAVDAECGRISVLENPDDPKGRRIDLFVARVPAVNRRKKADPLFILAGGPGGAATDFYTGVAGAFTRVRRDRDIVLVDQRGTGKSNGLYCDFDEDLLMTASDELIADVTRRCLSDLSKHADVKFYTTSLAVKDLDQVRRALGYQQINLYGVSYGSRVAQHYVRRFPASARTLILDGVVAPQVALGPALALDAEQALTNIFKRCVQESACHATFGDPAESYRALLTSLALRPVHVDLADPVTGEPTELEFSTLHFATVLRLGSYSADQAALLPLSLNLAHKQGNYGPLASQFLMVSRTLEEMIAYGMHNSVVCAEDVPFYKPGDIDREKLEKTYLGVAQVDSLVNVCALWPRGPMDADFHEPVRSDVPALLLSGTNDPVTPPIYANQARVALKNNVHIVLSGMGHGQVVAPCIDRVMAKFIDQGSVAGLDVSCAKNARPMPFFTSPAGPPP